MLAPSASLAQPAEATAGEWTVRGGYNRRSHTHGGAPATIGEVALELHGPAAGTAQVRVLGLRWLRGHCREEGYSDARTLEPLEIQIDGDPPAPASRRASARQGSQLVVTFRPIEAYQACDRFAVDVTLSVAGRRVSLRVPFEVWRREPLRR